MKTHIFYLPRICSVPGAGGLGAVFPLVIFSAIVLAAFVAFPACNIGGSRKKKTNQLNQKHQNGWTLLKFCGKN